MTARGREAASLTTSTSSPIMRMLIKVQSNNINKGINSVSARIETIATERKFESSLLCQLYASETKNTMPRSSLPAVQTTKINDTLETMSEESAVVSGKPTRRIKEKYKAVQMPINGVTVLKSAQDHSMSLLSESSNSLALMQRRKYSTPTVAYIIVEATISAMRAIRRNFWREERMNWSCAKMYVSSQVTKTKKKMVMVQYSGKVKSIARSGYQTLLFASENTESVAKPAVRTQR